MELEALLLELVESLRKSDFTMFVNTLEETAPWVFALDHTNYARWLPVFIEDLKRLSVSICLRGVHARDLYCDQDKQGHFHPWV